MSNRGSQSIPGPWLADMHVHTTASDGVWSPQEAVFLAKEKGLVAIGITDHDTVDGLKQAAEASSLSGVELIEGLEISTQVGDEDVHILAYYPNLDSPRLYSFLENMKEKRKERIERMMLRLKENGVKIDPDLLKSITGESTPGRPHLARALVKLGYATSTKEAFDLYLLPGRPGYYPRYRISPKLAIELVTEVGGIPVLAHPGLLNGHDTETMIREMVTYGLKGIEVFHPAHDPSSTQRYAEIGKSLCLLVTGGSDAHGPGYEYSTEIGDVRVPYHFV
ncbi:MAG TPA: PHP domain-containing protein, partial [Clostridia bacterium]|nr:PHP domain-containing protein [Clostridia bacterium]